MPKKKAAASGAYNDAVSAPTEKSQDATPLKSALPAEDESAASQDGASAVEVPALTGIEIAERLGLSTWAAPKPTSDRPCPEDLSIFCALMTDSATVWGDIFKDIPSDHKKRKDALGGVLKIKGAVKQMTAAASTLSIADSTHTESESVMSTPQAEAAAIVPGGSPVEEAKGKEEVALVSCQKALQQLIHGLIELTHPADEMQVLAEFPEQAAVDTAMDRLDDAAGSVVALGELFRKAGVNPAKTAEPDSEGVDSLQPQMAALLEDALKKRKKKGVDEKAAAAAEKARAEEKKTWLASEGLMTAVLSEAIWESLCWQRGAFLHVYIASKFGPLEKKEDAVAPLPCAVLDRCIKNLHHMLRAKGAIQGDLDDMLTWTLRGVKDADETGALFNHGIYSSMHLRALKYQAEVCYFRWRYYPESDDREIFKAYTTRTLLRFVHIVSDIMPQRGWICDIERKWLVEVMGGDEGIGCDPACGNVPAKLAGGVTGGAENELQDGGAVKKGSNRKKK